MGPPGSGAAVESGYILGAPRTRRRICMVADKIASAEGLWLSIRREANAVVAGDPVLGRSLSLAILDHPGLGSAVAFQIGQRLGGDSPTRAPVTRVANEAFCASPDLVEAPSPDLHGI